MEVLAWLAIPVVSTIGAIVWLAFANRARPPADAVDTVQEHERFRQALRQPPPGAAPRRDPRQT